MSLLSDPIKDLFSVSSTTATGITSPELRLEVGNQPYMVFDEVGLSRHDVERDMGIFGYLIVPPQRLDPLLVAVCALECAIDNGALADAAVMIFPAHG